jgi:hypothetical protein
MKELLERIRTFKKLDPFQRQMVLNRATSDFERQMFGNLFSKPGELERVEEQLKTMIRDRKSIYMEKKESAEA